MTDFDAQTGRALPQDPQLSSEQSATDEVDLQGGLRGLASLVSGAQELDGVLAEVAAYAASAIPGATGRAHARHANG